MSASSRMLTCARSAAVSTLAVLLIPLPPAQARPTYPSQEQVDSARATATQRAAQADQLQQRLSAVLEDLARLEVAADTSVEDFNEARATLQGAAVAAEQAHRRAEDARAEAAQARLLLGRIAASSYRSGGMLASLSLVLEAEGAAQVFDELGALRTVVNSQSGVYVRWQGARAKAEAAQDDADRALEAQERAAERARQAQVVASAAVDQQRRRVAETEAEREQITAALAAANRTSVDLERQRQEGLRAEAERQAREAAAREAREEAQRQAREQAAADAAESSTSEPRKATTSSRDSNPQPAATKASSGSVPYDAAAAKKVVAFARAQLGEPYVWGAAGPDAWDCSGLSMMAWRQAGIRLTHGARAQFRETRQISYGQLRPGDLVFHATGSTPSTIFHVGIYIGDGKMIHAPNSSRPVEIKSIFYMGSPGFYSRPMT